MMNIYNKIFCIGLLVLITSFNFVRLGAMERLFGGFADCHDLMSPERNQSLLAAIYERRAPQQAAVSTATPQLPKPLLEPLQTKPKPNVQRLSVTLELQQEIERAKRDHAIYGRSLRPTIISLYNSGRNTEIPLEAQEAQERLKVAVVQCDLQAYQQALNDFLANRGKLNDYFGSDKRSLPKYLTSCACMAREPLKNEDKECASKMLAYTLKLNRQAQTNGDSAFDLNEKIVRKIYMYGDSTGTDVTEKNDLLGRAMERNFPGFVQQFLENDPSLSIDWFDVEHRTGDCPECMRIIVAQQGKDIITSKNITSVRNLLKLWLHGRENPYAESLNKKREAYQAVKQEVRNETCTLNPMRLEILRQRLWETKNAYDFSLRLIDRFHKAKMVLEQLNPEAAAKADSTNG